MEVMEVIEQAFQVLAVAGLLAGTPEAVLQAQDKGGNVQHYSDNFAEPLSHTFINPEKKCAWLVVNSTDGLHVVVNGGPHCKTVTFIDGRRMAPERRADQ